MGLGWGACIVYLNVAECLPVLLLLLLLLFRAVGCYRNYSGKIMRDNVSILRLQQLRETRPISVRITHRFTY